ncbi:hypothetical protein PUN28_004134 [Cardiocondyla obscurior]|uniref:Uncharacterized protein n=1 Tax=Cardiocondyla obscurior TaxID=286306 RepID=A0AAW2GPP3_9HYME
MEGTGKEKKKRKIEGGGGEEERRKEKVRKRRGNLHNRAPNPPPQQFSGHRLFVYIGFSISIYNTPSPHAAAATVGRKSHRAEKWFSLGNIRWYREIETPDLKWLG